MNSALNQLILGSPLLPWLVDFFIYISSFGAIFLLIHVSAQSFFLLLKILEMRSSYSYVLAWTTTSDLLLIGPGSPYVPTNLVIVFNFACLQMCSNFKSTASTGSKSSGSSRTSTLSRSTSGVRTRSMKRNLSPPYRANRHPRAWGRRHPPGHDRDYARTLAPLPV